jgi:hypothetical protein
MIAVDCISNVCDIRIAFLEKKTAMALSDHTLGMTDEPKVWIY